MLCVLIKKTFRRLNHLKPISTKQRILNKLKLAASALLLVIASLLPTVTAAAKQSVLVSPTVNFTLDNVLLTPSADSQTLSFTLNLTNQSGSSVDLNQYGLRVLDKEGNKYSVQMVEKASARVLTHQIQGFKYAAQVPNNISIGQLRVNLFAWDAKSATFMRDLGSLDAAGGAAVNPTNPTKPVVLNLHNLNVALPSNTMASFELIRSFTVLKDDAWMVYSDVMVENLSNQAFQLPTNLLLNLRNETNQSVPASNVVGANQKILPKQRILLTFQASLTNLDKTNHLSLELLKKAASDSTDPSLLGSFAIDNSYQDTQVGSVLTYTTKSVNALSMIANRALYTFKTFGNEIEAEFTLKNEGDTVLTVPVLSGNFQVKGSTLSIAASETDTHPDILAPNQSSVYHFTAQFPKATDPSSIELVVNEKLSAGVSKPINVIHLPESGMQAADDGFIETTAFDMKNFDTALSKYSMLAFQVIRSYHSVSNRIPTINMEVVAKNQSTNTVKLPTSLAYTLYDSNHLSYPTTALSGADQSILPHQSIQFTLQASIGEKNSSHQYSLQFAKKSDTTSELVPVNDAFDLSSSFSNPQANRLLNTSVGKLGIKLISTYRLSTDGADDTLVSEVEIQNLDSKMITLPSVAANSIYGGYRINDLDAQGKVIQIQSSSNLYPNQKTSLYIYTKIPYTSTEIIGNVYLGNGTWNAQTSAWTQTNEWTELPYTLNDVKMGSIGFNTEWMIDDPGRTSVGQIVDSQMYDINSQKMLAVRILQTNKEQRNGSIVPYTGYIANADGSVLALKTTDDAAATPKMSKDGLSLTTLWTVLPGGSSTENQQFIFGQKLNEDAFAAPLQYAFTPSAIAASSSVSNVSVYPYTLSVQNAKLATTSNGAGANTVLGYNINFDYAISKALNASGSVKNRSLEFTLTDNNSKIIKTWSSGLEGTDALKTGVNKLSFTNADIPDLATFISYARQINVYEKFEGGTRLLGSVSVNL
jgi:hypothetical protein